MLKSSGYIFQMTYRNIVGRLRLPIFGPGHEIHESSIVLPLDFYAGAGYLDSERVGDFPVLGDSDGVCAAQGGKADTRCSIVQFVCYRERNTAGLF